MINKMMEYYVNIECAAAKKYILKHDVYTLTMEKKYLVQMMNKMKKMISEAKCCRNMEKLREFELEEYKEKRADNDISMSDMMERLIIIIVICMNVIIKILI